MNELEEMVFLTYIALDDALECLNNNVKGNKQNARELLEEAQIYFSVLRSILEETKVSRKVANEIYKQFGINIPTNYTLFEAYKVMGELLNDN